MTSNSLSVLIIDDEEQDRCLIKCRLRRTDRQVLALEADDLAAGIDMAKSESPDVVLLDLMLPTSCGLDTLRAFRSEVPDVPIVILTGIADTEMATKAICEGAQDFIEKSDLSNPWLLRCLGNAIQRHELQARLNTQSLRDALTGLPNRIHLEQCLDTAFRDARCCRRNFAVVFIDLDDFKLINDCYGHSEGDEVLVEFARRLQTCVRSSDVVARFGGDEFVTVLNGANTEADVSRFVDRLIATLDAPVRREDRELFLSASVGYVSFSTQYHDYKHMLRDADTAMYQAKQAGKRTHKRFSKAMRDSAVETIGIGSRLRQAIDNEEFFLAYQPIVQMNSGKIIKFEALLRWNHPENGLVPPLTFIPHAERNGLIVPIGDWVLDSACRQLKVWDQACPGNEIQLAINVSPYQLREPDFLARVTDILQRHHVTGDRIAFEITESALMEDSDQAISILQAFGDWGIEISIDDFGTGYSSLSQLHRFHFDCLKIDRSFVRELLTEGYADMLIQTILSLADSIGLEVVAEGVERQEELDRLTRLGCKLGQGYLFGRPVLAELATKMLEDQMNVCCMGIDN